MLGQMQIKQEILDRLDQDEHVLYEPDANPEDLQELPAVKRRTGRKPVKRKTRKRKAAVRKTKGRIGKRRKVTRRKSRKGKKSEGDSGRGGFRCKVPLVKLGITNHIVDGLDVDEEPIKPSTSSKPIDVKPTIRKIAPRPKPALATFDLLGSIMESQEKAMAPGELFKQENGRLVPTEKYEKYRDRKAIEAQKSNQKTKR